MGSGLLLVDKPLGVSSHTVVSWARKALGTKKVGHAGTLDPEASGLLVLGVGAGTRLLTFCVGMDKTYQARVRLGYATTTDDAEGERIDFPDGSVESCTPEQIDRVVNSFLGEIMQVPSSFSAIKVDGRRSYDRARKGEEVNLPPRPVTIHRMERGEITNRVGVIDLELLVECSSGTYIRALARDIGEQLGVGGHLIALRRLAVGPFELEGAPAASEIAPEHIVGMADAAGLIMPIVEVSGPAKDDIVHGRKIECTGWPEGQPLAVVDEGAGNLLAVIECVAGRSRILMGVPQS